MSRSTGIHRHQPRRVFKDRHEAGQVLAGLLQSYQGRPDVVVLGLARGGIPVAYEVAASLRAPLDVIVRVANDGKVFYVADLITDGVYLIDGDSFTQIGFIPAGIGTHGLYPSRDGKKLYVANRGSHKIHGPRGGPGMPEMLAPTSALDSSGAFAEEATAPPAAVRSGKNVKISWSSISSDATPVSSTTRSTRPFDTICAVPSVTRKNRDAGWPSVTTRSPRCSSNSEQTAVRARCRRWAPSRIRAWSRRPAAIASRMG